MCILDEEHDMNKFMETKTYCMLLEEQKFSGFVEFMSVIYGK